MFGWLGEKNIKAGVTALLVIGISIIFLFLFNNLGGIFKWFGSIFSIFTPLIIGLIMAYLLHPLVKFIEKKVFKKVQKESVRRNLSIALTVFVFVAIIAAFVGWLLPQILESILSIITNAPKYLDKTEAFLRKWLSNPDLDYDKAAEYLLNILNNNILPNVTKMLNGLGNGIVGFFKGIFNFFIGLVFAVYILANTKTIKKSTKKMMYTLFDDNKVDKFIKKVKHINDIFVSFMFGKITDSFGFVFVVTFLFTLICGYPYPLLIAFIIGFTDLIPYFGPYLGTIPSALLICLVDPVKALIFILFIVILQQVDSNLVTPRIQSKATGLPSFWVLFSITVFGGLFGIVGLLIAVPCFTIIYELVGDFIEEKYTAKLAKTTSLKIKAKAQEE